ncbi:hypothetical protein CKA04_13450 [Listeria monocytogenes]|nr:hypothetical protein [Listeria monocytogenes]
MTNKIRFTYRPPEELFQAISEEANRKQMAINSVITTILWKHYFPNKKQCVEKQTKQPTQEGQHDHN